MMTRRVLAAGAAAVMVAIGLTAVPATADSTHTLVTLNFTGNGCDGCVITPRQLIYAWDNGGQELSWDGQSRKVRGDSVTFRVPTESTRGMYFYIDEPAFDSDGFYDAAPMVVFQYGVPAGGMGGALPSGEGVECLTVLGGHNRRQSGAGRQRAQGEGGRGERYPRSPAARVGCSHRTSLRGLHEYRPRSDCGQW